MRCKACDILIEAPIRVHDTSTGNWHEEALCARCERLAFVRDDDEDYLMYERFVLETEGKLKMEKDAEGKRELFKV